MFADSSHYANATFPIELFKGRTSRCAINQFRLKT